jgi:quercetin dioxygenase-like cupin family protein
MIIKKLEDVSEVKVPGLYNQVTKQVVLGPDDGSSEIILRYFKLAAGGKTPRHTHAFPHLVKVEKGQGVYVDENGDKHDLEVGSYVYVNDEELHNFENTGNAPMEFICIVPKRGEN